MSASDVEHETVGVAAVSGICMQDVAEHWMGKDGDWVESICAGMQVERKVESIAKMKQDQAWKHERCCCVSWIPSLDLPEEPRFAIACCPHRWQGK